MKINQMWTSEDGRTSGIILNLFRNQAYKGNPVMFSIRVRFFGKTFSYQSKNYRAQL